MLGMSWHGDPKNQIQICLTILRSVTGRGTTQNAAIQELILRPPPQAPPQQPPPPQRQWQRQRQRQRHRESAWKTQHMLHFWNPDDLLIPNMMIDRSLWSSCSCLSPWLGCYGHTFSSTGPSVSPFRDFFLLFLYSSYKKHVKGT